MTKMKQKNVEECLRKLCSATLNLCSKYYEHKFIGDGQTFSCPSMIRIITL